MHFNSEEKPLQELRWNTCHASNLQPRLQQQWYCRDGDKVWTEWRDVQFVHEEDCVKTPLSGYTMD